MAQIHNSSTAVLKLRTDLNNSREKLKETKEKLDHLLKECHSFWDDDHYEDFIKKYKEGTESVKKLIKKMEKFDEDLQKLQIKLKRYEDLNIKNPFRK